MGEVAALRQLVSQVQELWDLYGANAQPVPRSLHHHLELGKVNLRLLGIQYQLQKDHSGGDMSGYG